MTFSHHYNQDSNFLFTQIDGRIDDKSLLEHVQYVNDTSNGLTGLRELADTRGISNVEDLTVAGTTHCAQWEQNKPGSKLAIVTPVNSPLIFGMARSFQTFSKDHREAVQIFTNLKDALVWLADHDHHDAEQLTAYINTVSGTPSL